MTLDLREELSIGSDDDERQAFYGPPQLAVDYPGRFFVLDSGNSRLQIFDRDAKYVRTIGRPGQGPGDLNRPSSVEVGADGVILVFQPPSRLSLFDRDGRFQKVIDFLPAPQSLIRLGDSGFLGSVIQSGPEVSRDQAVLFDAQGRQARTLAAFENENLFSFVGSEIIGIYQPFKPHLWCVSLPEGRAAFAFSKDYRIHVLDRSGQTVRIIIKDEEPERITDGEKERAIDNEVGLRRNRRLSVSRDEVKRTMLFPKNRPFFWGLFSDDRSRIYVLKSGDYRKDGFMNYDVFDPRGIYIKKIRIAVTGRMLPKLIRDGCLYAVAVDEEGLFSIKKYSISNWNELVN